MWISTLDCLRSQKGYLDNLLSKTAVTLNALRERQTRNERALSTNPTPRSKRKKIQQNKWRTNKTIQTCENEERAILDCLQVCSNNISTLESIINPTDLSSTAVECTVSNPYALSDTTSFDWNGWTDNAAISPFQRDRERPLPMDEIPPETPVAQTRFRYMSPTLRRPPPLPLRAHRDPTALVPPVPPNTAHSQFSHSALSPEAAVIEPSVTHVPHCDDELPRELDKLSISGLLSSKRMHRIVQKRFSDAAIGHLFGRLSSSRPAATQTRSHQSWAAPTPEQKLKELGVVVMAMAKRTNSV
ncbi:hypothetical protein K458DRAFT_288892 [Lentithecium fluviatile CBS 122367]|uniref:Uncharacterized protein n=1 Tax=Lentithecium fluviatile CBS 122367 TaxID=1168545 RepID=A0A6G1JK33_9PLEO|nr:hypothetical protein K458DRAFT_288892 [Lentithecium fluviatile CBS 122367]